MTYTSSTKYVDIETGQQITAREAKKHYLIIKTIKHANTKWNEGRCHIEYTKQCKRDPQQRLFSS